jgi:hypothetical protein
MKRLVWAFVLATAAFGLDRLEVTDAAGPAGATVNLLLTLNTTSASLSGLQWELSVPAGVMYGLATTLPGKGLTCSGARCLLVGDSKVIRSGPVGVLAVTVPQGTNKPIPIAVSKVRGVLADGTAQALAGSTASISPGGTVCPPCNCTSLAAPKRMRETTLFEDTSPQKQDAGPEPSVELGVKFTSEVAGMVMGIRFYKSAENTGPHVGTLWSDTGTKLATVPFARESSSGWQVAMFPRPVEIRANVPYVASYLCPKGHYAADAAFFTRVLDNLPLRGLTGVFAYGSTSTFPKESFHATNYWVDVIFRPK